MTDRLFAAWRAARIFAVTTLVLMPLGFAACRGPDAPIEEPGVDAAVSLPVDMAGPRADAAAGAVDLSRPTDLTGVMWPAPMMPPATCNMRSPGLTAIQAMLRIDSYGGLQTGRNGVHELAEATLIYTVWVFDKTRVDTSNIHLAMNVASATDSQGLPMELPLVPGQIIEVEGEYIPAATAGSTNPKGPAAVVHFTHSPCGYAVISGKTYN